jgi:hypothetical protein
MQDDNIGWFAMFNQLSMAICMKSIVWHVVVGCTIMIVSITHMRAPATTMQADW